LRGTAQTVSGAAAAANMRVGFIGLGMMGKGMAANLQKAGHELVVHDLSRAAAEPFLAKGAVWANSPKQVGEQSEIVFTSLPVPADVEQVALGTNGLIEGMRPDTAIRHVDQFGGDGAQDPRHLCRKAPLHARCAGQGRPLRCSRPI
jgi:3-hydroxyisobutyrate dehydrogenase-like beta-hydroxyacid dehydrogenase